MTNNINIDSNAKAKKIEEYRMKTLKELIDKKIENETLDVTGHSTEYASAKKQLEKDYGHILDFTNRWGCLMQVKMKEQNKSLTADMHSKSLEEAKVGVDVDPIAYTVTTQLLSVTWKYGEDFAKYEGMDLASVKEARVAFADKEGCTRPKVNSAMALKGNAR